MSSPARTALVRSAWGYGVDALVPLPRPAAPAGAVGPRRHWRAEARGRPTLLVTEHRFADAGGGAGTGSEAGAEATRLEDTLAATTDLSFGLDFVIASLPSSAGTWTVPVGGGAVPGALSAAPWVHGEAGSLDPGVDPARMLARLHAAHPPRRAPRWQPLTPSQVQASPEGPAYLRLVERAGLDGDHPGVPTHGDPGPEHRLLTPVRTLLTGWSGLRIAPRERDGVAGDPVLVELFALERGLLAMGLHQGR